MSGFLSFKCCDQPLPIAGDWQTEESFGFHGVCATCGRSWSVAAVYLEATELACPSPGELAQAEALDRTELEAAHDFISLYHDTEDRPHA